MFFLGPIQSEIFAEGFTESNSVVVKYSVADTQWKRIWQNDHVVTARVRWMHLNITCLCWWNYVVWYVLFYGYDLEWLEIQSHEHEHALIRVSLQVWVCKELIYLWGKKHSLYTEIKVICVFLQKNRVCSSVCSVCTYMSIHMHECFPTIYPMKMGWNVKD